MKVRNTLTGRARVAVAGAAALFAVGLAAPASAAPASATVENDTLTVAGSSGSDRVALRLAVGDPDTLEVDLDDDGTAEHSFDRTTFSTIDVALGSGGDSFRIDQVNGAFADEVITVDGESGNDTLDGGDGNETFIAASGSDLVDGNKGADTAFLGSGADVFRWDPGDGSDVVEGDSGNDTLDFNGAEAAENMDLTPNGPRSLFLRDPGTIRMDMDNVEVLDLDTLGGIDDVTIDDMSGTDMRRADVDLSGAAGGGDGADDVVTVEGTEQRDRIRVEGTNGRVDVKRLAVQTRVIGSDAADVLQVNGNGGNDDVDLNGSATALIGIVFDLRAG